MGLKEHDADRRIPGRSDGRGADRARLPDRRRARPRTSPSPAIARQHTHLMPGGLAIAVQGAPADLRDPAHRPRLVAGGRAVGQRSRRPRARGRAGGGVRRRRLYRDAARRVAAARLRTMCRRRSTAASRPSSCTPAAASPAWRGRLRQQLSRLQRARQRGAAGDRRARCREIDVGVIPAAPMAPRRANAPPAPKDRRVTMRTGAEYRDGAARRPQGLGHGRGPRSTT